MRETFQKCAIALLTGLLAGPGTLRLGAIELPPTDHEYTWVERQEINFQNQQLLVDVEPAIGRADWAEAEAILKEALANDPNNNVLKGRLLTVLAEAGKNREALEMAYPLLKRYPRHVPLVQFIGNVENAAGNREAANKAWTYILALPNVPDDARLFAAKSLYFEVAAGGDTEEALRLARIWARLEPGYQSNLRYASALWKTGKQEAALETLRKAVRLARPAEKEEARFYLAYTLLKAGEGQEAESVFREIATGSPSADSRYRASMQLAYLKMEAGDMPAAREWLETAALDGEKNEQWKAVYSQTILEEGDVQQTLAAAGTIFDAEQASFLMLLSFQFLKNGYDGLAYYFIRQAENRPGLPEKDVPEYWANRAYMAENQDNFEDALASIDQALAREPGRADWEIVRVRSLFMLGESREAIDAALQLEEDVARLPVTPENTRIQNEAIELIANSFLAEGEYRKVLRTAERFSKTYSGKGLYRAVALAYYHLGRYEDSEKAFQYYFRVEPDPDPVVWMEYGYLQEKRGEWDLAAKAFLEAVRRNPFDLRSWKTLTYVRNKAGENEKAVESAKATIDLEHEILPSARGQERGEIEQSLRNFKMLIGDIEKTWGFSAFANNAEFLPGAEDVFVTRDSGLPAELGAQISYRPPVIGFRDYSTFDIFLRVIGAFKDGTIEPDPDLWQGGLGADWKPFKQQNYVTSFEYLFKIGDRSREGWLWRNRLSYATGDYPRADDLWWPTLVLYGEAAWFFDRDFEDQELALFTEDRAGISWRITDHISLTLPQIQGTIRYVIRDYTERSSYYFWGLGANLRIADDEDEYSIHQWYIDLFLHYDWGRFLDEDARPTGSRFDGVAAGIRFYR